MRGLLPGCEREKPQRVPLTAIMGCRIIPDPTKEELELLYKLEIGAITMPPLAVDAEHRLVLLDVGDISGEKNHMLWRVLNLGRFSTVKVNMVKTPTGFARTNMGKMGELNRAADAAMRQLVEEQENAGIDPDDEDPPYYEDEHGDEEQEDDDQ